MSNKIYIVVNNDVKQGTGVLSFYTKEKAVKAYKKIIENYKVYGEIDPESELNDSYAEIIVNGDEVGKIYWQETIIK